MKKKKWIKEECYGGKSYNPECERGTCNLYLYKWKNLLKNKEKNDSS